ncbi:MAG: outer membrane protein assembly factor BamD [Alteromonadaceae bacterium]|uniref:outer membrane protein assembly factor BamD n=1 Tax=unclassified Marinobacter TaxID=83889 RepID=UPI000C5F985C|nr:outer membrane protein assembly factor BamD [Marinobacter sp. BGYM27]MAA66793.1 outer membrane protein assembly factor BamD [Alteromonadaceae bacterium]MBH86781.1 outer membrane protein assembly factor BamD [Alteromonadaceae bacterium]MDG5500668.1 outer membrane protein assembly factor BamD [Marinobacter sp. BGYM27]
MRSVFHLLLLSALFVVAGCASKPEEVLSEEAYYEQAHSAMESGNFNEAETNLEALETYYPFGRYAEQAQLDLIYSRYQNLDLEGARAAADRFLRLNPQSEHADYAMYMRGIASYNLDISLASKFFPIDTTERDPGEQRQAFRDFSALLDRYPASEYAPDARQRMIAIRNRLAALELHAARYYIKRQAYAAANNRARHVVENFPNTPAVEEALIILADTYKFLDLNKAANDAIALLAINYPQSKAFDDNMKYVPSSIKREERSIKSVITFGLMGDE